MLALGVGSILGACRSASSSSGTGAPSLASKSPGAASAPLPALDEEPPLETISLSKRPESERGGVAVVLLHGFGAAGNDLVSLAERWARPGARFFVPAAPLARGATGRAWWLFDEQRPAHAQGDQLPPGFRPHQQVQRVRRAVQRLLQDIRARYAPERLVLGGFSQGAMLSLDVALQAQPAVDRVIALSGVLLADSLPALQAAREPRPRIFVSHGRQDQVLPFSGGERARLLLEQHGYAVQFQAFEGGHQIPNEVTAAARDFIYDGL